jgi:hypothetical protein
MKPSYLPTCAIISLLIGAVPPCAFAQQHVETTLGWSKTAVTNTALDARIRDAAKQYRTYAPIPRTAFFDIAYPKDSSEAQALSGYAVMVVTALVQDSTELPLTELYFRTASGDRPFDLYSSVASTVVDTVISATFGRFRLDALYLIPLASRLVTGELLADFATHRRGFRLGQFDGQVPEQLQHLGTVRTPQHLPPDAAVAIIVRREYPDLAPLLLHAR